MSAVWIFVLGAAAGIAVLAVIVIVAGLARRQQMSWNVQSYALGQGWTYNSQLPELIDRWPDLPLSGLGTHPRDVVSGQHQGVPFVACTLVPGREDHPGDALRHVSGAGVLALRTPSDIGCLTLTPRGFVESFDVEGDVRVMTTGVAPFDAQWNIGGDPALGEQLVTEEVMAWLLKQDHVGSYGFDRGDLVTWSVERVRPPHMAFYLAQLEELMGLVPKDLWLPSAVAAPPE